MAMIRKSRQILHDAMQAWHLVEVTCMQAMVELAVKLQ